MLSWIKEAVKKFDIKDAKIGAFNAGISDGKGQMDAYFKVISRAKIHVTANPLEYEGDHRLWEALASGALVFVDIMRTPLPRPLQNERHLIYYSMQDKAAFLQKINHYVNHPVEAAQIAQRGYLEALRYHQAANRVDHMISTALVVQELAGKYRNFKGNILFYRKKLSLR